MAHPDNTMRALKDQPLFVDRWQCKLGWHRWTKWGVILRSRGGSFAEQHRECVDCGQVRVRKVDSNVG
jgi:hypothetical protein